jgi:hypothetical protein
MSATVCGGRHMKWVKVSSGVASKMVKPFFSVGLSFSSKLKYRQSDQYHRSRTSDSRSILFLIECGVGKETSPYAFDQEV